MEMENPTLESAMKPYLLCLCLLLSGVSSSEERKNPFGEVLPDFETTATLYYKHLSEHQWVAATGYLFVNWKPDANKVFYSKRFDSIPLGARWKKLDSIACLPLQELKADVSEAYVVIGLFEIFPGSVQNDGGKNDPLKVGEQMAPARLTSKPLIATITSDTWVCHLGRWKVIPGLRSGVGLTLSRTPEKHELAGFFYESLDELNKDVQKRKQVESDVEALFEAARKDLREIIKRKLGAAGQMHLVDQKVKSVNDEYARKMRLLDEMEDERTRKLADEILKAQNESAKKAGSAAKAGGS